MIEGKQVLGEICRLLDERDWRYECDEEALHIVTGIQMEDGTKSMIYILVFEEASLIQFRFEFPFVMPEDKRIEGAIAAAVVSDSLLNGSIDYDIRNGALSFRMTQSYLNGMPGCELIEYMFGASFSTLSENVSKFYLLSEGMVTVSEFIEDILNH